ncbi:MAG: autotransporter domain-containing protein, partial [Pseudomonadota bacterium]
ALDVDRSAFESVQARLGFKAASDESDVKFALTGDFVNELATIEDQFTAGFVGLNTGDALFPLISADKDWFEFGVSLGFDVNNSRIALSADTTAGRSDLEAQSYRASVSYKF